MFCAKCGKNNVEGSIKCKYCSEKMPPVSQSNGFCDILSYEGAESVEEIKSQTTKTEGVNMEQKEEKKSGSKLGVIAVILSAIALLVSAVCLVIVLTKPFDNGEVEGSDTDVNEVIDFTDVYIPGVGPDEEKLEEETEYDTEAETEIPSEEESDTLNDDID